MPSRWWVPVMHPRPESVRLEHVHAAISRWFDLEQGEHSAIAKPYALSPLGHSPFDETLGLEVGVLSDQALERLTGTDRPRSIRLGHEHCPVGQPSRLLDENWETLAEPSGRTSWELELLTPATFRRGDRSSPLPIPSTVLRGLAQSWDAYSPIARTDLTAAQRDAVWVSDLDGRSERVKVSGTQLSGFVGRVRFRIDDRSIADAVDPLFRLAPFAGVGSARAKGLGVARLTPEGTRRSNPRSTRTSNR